LSITVGNEKRFQEFEIGIESLIRVKGLESVHHSPNFVSEPGVLSTQYVASASTTQSAPTMGDVESSHLLENFTDSRVAVDIF
jgi:hypothetical protein